MNKKLNCWEFMKCGKGTEPAHADKPNVCPVAAEASADGLNRGLNGGRICWVIAEERCKDKIKCSGLHHDSSCFSCEFRHKVMAEEGLIKVCKSTGVFLFWLEAGVLEKLP